MKLKVDATEKPKWHQFRWRLSNFLIKLARKVRPENPQLKAYLLESMMDHAIYGGAIRRIDPVTIGGAIDQWWKTRPTKDE